MDNRLNRFGSRSARPGDVKQVLTVLANCPEPLSPQNIARAGGLTLTAARVAIDQLASRGMVEISRQHVSPRVLVHIAATKSGDESIED